MEYLASKGDFDNRKLSSTRYGSRYPTYILQNTGWLLQSVIIVIILEYLTGMLTDLKKAEQYLYFIIHCLIVAIIYQIFEISDFNIDFD